MIKTFDFDETIIDVYVEHKLFQYDEEGKKTTTETRYEVRSCIDSDFNDT